MKISIFYLNQIKLLLQETKINDVLKTNLYQFIKEVSRIFFSICKVIEC